MLMLNICVDAHKDKKIREAQTEDEFRAAIADALADMQGGCITSIAALSRVSQQTIYAIKSGKTKPAFGTLLALASVLAPGYAVSFSAACAAVVRPRVLSWVPHPTAEGYEIELINGKETGLSRYVKDGHTWHYRDGKHVPLTAPVEPPPATT